MDWIDTCLLASQLSRVGWRKLEVPFYVCSITLMGLECVKSKRVFVCCGRLVGVFFVNLLPLRCGWRSCLRGRWMMKLCGPNQCREREREGEAERG